MTTAIFRHPTIGRTFVDMEAAKLARLRRRHTWWAEAVNKAIDGEQVEVWGVMLTYRTLHGWRPYDISHYLDDVRTYYGDALLAYAWVAELQDRGAPHYHVTLVMRKGTGMRHADKMGWWLWGWTGTVKLKQHVSAHYLVKYLQKNTQKSGPYPKGMRAYGSGMAGLHREKLIADIDYFRFRLTAIPGYVAEAVKAMAFAIGLQGSPERFCSIASDGWHWQPIDGGGWLVQFADESEVIQSTWEYVGIEGAAFDGTDRSYCDDP